MTLRKFAALAGLLVATLIIAAGCAMGPTATGNFDRTLTVSGPIRLEISNTSGDVSVTGSGDGKVHVHAEARASGTAHCFPAPSDVRHWLERLSDGDGTRRL